MKLIYTIAKCGVTLSICFFALFVQRAEATHIAGADLTYAYIGNNAQGKPQYTLTLTLYRDCAGVAAPTNPTITYKSTALGVNSTFTLTMVPGPIQEITIPCQSGVTTCSGGSATGIQKYIYTGTVALTGNATDWVFSWQDCCRNCAINTITNQSNCTNTSSGNSMYIEAMLNNTISQHNSPTFSNNPLVFACANINLTYNHGALGSNGDSLSYSLIVPRRSPTVDIAYISPYSFTNPLASTPALALSTTNGNLTMHATQVGQITVMAVLVKEYRNRVLVGSVVRDMQIYVVDCNNNLPFTKGIDDNNTYSKTVCPGVPFCFTIKAYDNDGGDNVTISWNGGIPGATFTITPGSRPSAQFCWTPTQADVSLTPHNFTVTVQDNHCPTNGIQIVSFSINVPSPIFSITSAINPTCNGLSNGSLTATPTYVGSTYAYVWSNSATGATASNLSAGTYTVTVTDMNGCHTTASATLTQPPAISLSAIITPANCNGGNGSIDLTASGGQGSFTYVWSNNATTQDISNVPAAAYSVTVKDAGNCTATLSSNITQPSAISITTTPQNVACNGQSSGSVATTVTGGTSPYTYSWSNGTTAANLSNIAAGTYTLTVTDAHNCVATKSVTITQPVALSGSTTVSNVSCSGGNNGAVNLTPSGGTSPYTFAWSNGGTTQNISGLTSGTYSVTITDSHGCTTIASGTVSQAGSLTSSATATNVSCNGLSNGVIDLSVSGGTSPYIYSWNNAAITQDISSLGAATYTVTINDANGCQLVSSYTVTQPAVLGISGISSPALCLGSSDGSIDASISGGTSPYTYSWSNGNTSEDVNGITAGSYSLNVTDAHGCTASNSFIVAQPSQVSIQLSGINVSCNGLSDGSVNTTVSGGTAPYTFVWSDGETSQNILGLTVGTYTVIVKDAHLCTATTNITITQPAPLQLSATHVDPLCFGSSNGSVNLSVSGGTSPYSYSWSNSITTEDQNGIPAGLYNAVVTDAHGCTDNLYVNLSNPAQLDYDITTDSVSCYGGNNGSVTAQGIGGTSPYSYLWDDGSTSPTISNLPIGTYNVIIADANGCTVISHGHVYQPDSVLYQNVSVTNNPCFGGNLGSIDLTVEGGVGPYTYLWSNGKVTEDQTGLVAGAYSVVITDTHGCVKNSVFTINEPPLLQTANATSDYNGYGITCNGSSTGTIDVTVSGGTAPYTYSWSNGSTTEDQNNLTAGNYSVTVTDANGCTSTSAATLTQPDAIAVPLQVANISNVTCFGNLNGSVDIEVSGGTIPYTYSWSNGATTEDISNIGAGIYSVTVTDANGCMVLFSSEITQPEILASSIASIQNSSCNGVNDGSINLSVTGGTSPYTYQWSNGASTKDLSNVGAGTYIVVITDAQNCSITDTAQISQPQVILSNLNNSVGVSCFGFSNGSVDLTVNGGTLPYSYQWSNGAITEDLNNITAGVYSVTITDQNGCIQHDTIAVNQPAALTSSGEVIDNVGCNGSASGAINLTISGGTQPYLYQWSNGATTEDISNLIAGIYTLIVTDLNGCTLEDTFEVIQSLVLDDTLASPSLNGTNSISCFGQTDGSIDLTVSGGTQPYTYQWSNGATTEDISNLGAGTYTVTITDVNGCSSTSSLTLTQPGQLIAVAGDGQTVCGGITVLNADPAPAGMTGSWSVQSGSATFSDASDPSSVASDLGSGNNVLVWTVTDGVCIDTSEVTIYSNDSISVNAGGNLSVCDSTVVLTATFTGSGSGHWDVISSASSTIQITNPNNATTTVINLGVGDNIFEFVVNEGACEARDTVLIQRQNPADCGQVTPLEMPTAFSPNGDGYNDYFVIHGIENYPSNTLTIFNRWGNVVFTEDNYQNDWQGQSSKGGMLPDATYFVIFTVKNSDIALTGYVDMRR